MVLSSSCPQLLDISLSVGWGYADVEGHRQLSVVCVCVLQAASCLVSSVACNCMRAHGNGRFTGQARSFVLPACLGRGVMQQTGCSARPAVRVTRCFVLQNPVCHACRPVLGV